MRRLAGIGAAATTAAVLLTTVGCGSGNHSRPATTRGAVTASPEDALDGVYETDVDRSDLVRAGDAVDAVPENLGHYVYVFDRGRFAFSQEDAQACTWGYGDLVVRGKSMIWRFIGGGGPKAPNDAYNKPGETFEFRWSLYRDSLTLSPVPGATSPAPTFVDPWHRVSNQPARSYLGSDCPPPKGALP